MILGIYIFTKRGKKFVFRKELRDFDDDTIEIINKGIMNIVNKFDSYEQGVYRTELISFKILFAVFGEVISILITEEEEYPDDEEITQDMIDATDALFASIIFNQPLLTKLIKEQSSEEDLIFYSHELPKEKEKTISKPHLGKYIQPDENKKYVKQLDSIVDEVSSTLNEELKPKEEEEIFTIQKVFSNFIELTFRYARMYIMENLIRDLIEDNPGDITDIKMGVNDLLFYFRKSIFVLKDRPEIKYFLKIMDGKKIGIEIKNRTAFTTLFLEEAIEISNGIDKEAPLIHIDNVQLAVDLILGKFDVLDLALSEKIKVTQLHKFVEWAAPLAAVLIKVYEKQEIDKIISIKRLTLDGLAHLIEALFIANLEKDREKLSAIIGMKKIIYLDITDLGSLTLNINGNKKNIRKMIEVKIGHHFLEPDIVLQGSLKHICLYANGEISFITAIRKVKLVKGISMNPLDLIKGKTFKQISDLFSLWQLTKI
jgi:predicted nucleic acid-binding protein